MAHQYLEQLFGLQGKNIVVLGGGGVLGSAMALGLARAGAAKVVITSRTLEKAQKVAASLDQPGSIIGLACDVSSSAGLQSFKKELEKNGITEIHCLVNGAGGNDLKATVTPDQTIFDVEPAAFDELVRLNFLSAFYAVRELGPLLIKAKDSSIINIGSMSGETPLTRVLGYSTAKAGLHSLTKWLAVEFAQKTAQYGGTIRVNCIAPGFFPAEQNKALLFDKTKTELPFPQNLSARGQRIIGQTPMGRFGEPSDLVGLTVFLASPSARFMTGAVVPVDGGFSSLTI